MNITINNATVASAGPDQTTCGASSITLAANATTGGNWTGGAGSFAPDRNTANATYTPAVSEIGTTITLHGMFLILMVLVLVLLQLIK
jgi:hypothetical protein